MVNAIKTGELQITRNGNVFSHDILYSSSYGVICHKIGTLNGSASLLSDALKNKINEVVQLRNELNDNSYDVVVFSVKNEQKTELKSEKIDEFVFLP